jgi:hypothetical protein
MFNSFVEYIGRHKKIIPVVVALAAISAYMIPANSLALGAITGSGNVVSTITQSNTNTASNSGTYGGAFADFNFQANSASNTANVALSDPAYHGKIIDSGNVLQSIDQSNSNTATNTGDFGTASASNNFQTNTATNDASVNINSDPGGSYHHGSKIKDSGNVIQSITQSNDNSASNSGASGTATTDNNVQVNDAHNHADVNIGSSDPSNHNSDHKDHKDHKSHGSKVSDSANVVQSISQSNSNKADNSGDHGTASSSHNTQVNSASNDAHVSVSK